MRKPNQHTYYDKIEPIERLSKPLSRYDPVEPPATVYGRYRVKDDVLVKKWKCYWNGEIELVYELDEKT